MVGSGTALGAGGGAGAAVVAAVGGGDVVEVAAVVLLVVGAVVLLVVAALVPLTVGPVVDTSGALLGAAAIDWAPVAVEGWFAADAPQPPSATAASAHTQAGRTATERVERTLRGARAHDLGRRVGSRVVGIGIAQSDVRVVVAVASASG